MLKQKPLWSRLEDRSGRDYVGEIGMGQPPIDDVKSYVHPGEPHFEAPHPGLREHMRAAYAVSQAPPLPDPGRTGDVTPQQLNSLWEIITFVGTNWDISAQSKLTQQAFEGFVGAKTGAVPSYYTVYAMADAMLSQLVQNLGSLNAALAYLYTPDPPNPPENWDVVRFWVVQEFATFYVVQGAFRTYGWALYPGFGGGPFDDPSHLPYRPMSNGR